MKQRFYLFLMRFAYNRLKQEKAKLPDGIPGLRSVDAKCTGYAPRKLAPWETTSCDGDGHYLCRECCFHAESEPCN